MAIALEPGNLALVRVEILKPELRRVRVWREGADRLHVDTGDNAGLRHDHVDGRVALQRVAAGKRVVVPENKDWRLTLRKRCRLPGDGNEIALGIKFLE